VSTGVFQQKEIWTMFKRIIASAGFFFVLMAGAVPGFAQSRFEATAFWGWAFSDGVSAQQGVCNLTSGNCYDRVDPKDSNLFGLGFGINLNDNTEAGFLYSHQFSKLTVGGALGTPDADVGDMKVENYHGYLAYNFMEPDSKFRPYLYGGLGATNFGSVDFSTPFRSGTVGGNAQFSTTWGTGVKYYPGERIGLRFGVSWTPTYIKSDASGWWCDPWWGCYVVGDAQYSNQIQLNVGMTFRF
jgi:outer membrane protein W